MKRTLLLSIMSAMCWTTQAQDSDWALLFDGKTLEGWSVKSGHATYKVENGVILGKTAKGSPNTFLFSDKEYDNFELEFEVKVDDGLNSGVQIRSKLKDVDTDKYGGRVYGPQVEIESGPGQAGWIYGEATKFGWLSEKPKSKDATVNQHDHFKNGEWNKYRVLAEGARIQVWINGNKIADLTHEEIFKSHPNGRIGLQVHGIGEKQGPFEVRWRNLRIRPLK